MSQPAERVMNLASNAAELVNGANALCEALQEAATHEDTLAVPEHAELDTFELYVVTLEATLALLGKRLATCQRLVTVLKAASAREPAGASPGPAAVPKVKRPPVAPMKLSELVDEDALRAATEPRRAVKLPPALQALRARAQAAGVELADPPAGLPPLPAADEEPVLPSVPGAAFGAMPVPPDEGPEPVFPDQADFDKRVAAELARLNGQ